MRSDNTNLKKTMAWFLKNKRDKNNFSSIVIPPYKAFSMLNFRFCLVF